MPEESEHKITPIGKPEEVPVFDCTVLVSKIDGQYVARCATLPDVSATGASERAALQQIVAAFKAEVQKYETREAIPFLSPPLTASVDEEVRLLAVHL